MTPRLLGAGLALTLLVAPRLARASLEGEVGAGAALSVPASSPLPTVAPQGGPLPGGYGELRAGWRLVGGRAFGLGLRLVDLPTAASTQNRLSFVPHLYYREVVRDGGLAGATVEVALGLATGGGCLQSECGASLRPATSLAFGLPLSLGFGELLAKIGVTFEASFSPFDGGSTITPTLGVAYVLPRP